VRRYLIAGESTATGKISLNLSRAVARRINPPLPSLSCCLEPLWLRRASGLFSGHAIPALRRGYPKGSGARSAAGAAGRTLRVPRFALRIPLPRRATAPLRRGVRGCFESLARDIKTPRSTRAGPAAGMGQSHAGEKQQRGQRAARARVLRTLPGHATAASPRRGPACPRQRSASVAAPIHLPPRASKGAERSPEWFPARLQLSPQLPSTAGSRFCPERRCPASTAAKAASPSPETGFPGTWAGGSSCARRQEGSNSHLCFLLNRTALWNKLSFSFLADSPFC